MSRESQCMKSASGGSSFCDSKSSFEKSRPENLLQFTAVTYNVHQCVGIDGQRDPERILKILKKMKSDIIGLQEVHSMVGSSSETAQMKYLARGLGFEPVAGTTVFRPDSHYGNVLLTRFPVSRVRLLDLSYGRREPRGAIDVTVSVYGSPMRVIVTHFGLSPFERSYQANKLLDHVNKEQLHPMVILTDLNEWFPWGGALRMFKKRFGESSAPPTFPSPLPLLPLDRIWVNPPTAIRDIRAYKSTSSRIASDHLPLKALISMIS